MCLLDPANMTAKQKPRLITFDTTSTERAELEHAPGALQHHAEYP